MKYSDIRGNIRSGDVLAWSHKSCRTWYDIKVQLVRIFTRSEYSHIGTAWVIGNRVFVIEAVVPLVRIYPLSRLGNFYWVPMHAEWRPETEALALSKIGEKYSQIDAISSLFKKLKTDSKWECAELVYTIAKSDGINLGEVATPSAVMEKAQLLSPIMFVANNGLK